MFEMLGFGKPGSKTFIIGEAGVNHNGDLSLAKKMVDSAIYAGADAIKFQTWKPGELTGKYAIKVKYIDNGSPETRYDLSRRLALTYSAFEDLQAYCNKKGILFLSTPDGYESLNFLVDGLQIPIIKISSTEVTHIRFLKEVAKKGRPIILSTGMSWLGEVEKSIRAIREFFKGEIVLLHCTSEYPAQFEEINLKAMITMKNAFGLSVGFSDHSMGSEAAIAAVALGASVIEKHFTLDKSLEGPDHKASANVEELKNVIDSIRITERLLGDGIKKPSPTEINNIGGIRRGIVATKHLERGTILTRDHMTFKRPFIEIEPEQIDILCGMKINKDLEEDEPITWNHVK
jgi:N-acetylneuraminate synthase/N,N'-diacetyllegionaminate synthase